MTVISTVCPHCRAVLKIRNPKLFGHRARCPKCSQGFLLEEPEAVGAAAASAVVESATSTALPSPSGVDVATLPIWPVDGAPHGVAGQSLAQRKKHRQRTLVATCMSAVILLAASSVGYYVYDHGPQTLSQDELAAVDVAPPEMEENAAADAADHRAAGVEVQPIDLQYIPAGTRIVIHLRPADLWQADSQGEELRYCLGPISEFLAAKIKQLSKREPSQIREALFCLISGERGTAPDLAAVFHLMEDAKKSELLDQFGGQRVESGEGTPYYITGNDLAYLIPDLKTIAVCPAKLGEEMAFAMQERNPTSEGILDLLPMTDRSRPVTVVLEPVTTRIDAEFLVPPTAIPLLEQFFDWLGDDVETVAWSLELQPEMFRSELVIRNQAGQSVRALEQRYQQGLDGLAGKMLDVVRQLNPREVGKRKVIGRFPVMTKALALATRLERSARAVTLKTRLPERAAPNLALGALLAWDESTRTQMKMKSSSAEPTDDQPDLTPIAEKLKRRITVEFRKTPLQVAFETIADEIKSKVVIDGDGLKLSAYTKNMEQNFAMENVPAISAIERILKQPMYDKMCLVVDVQQNSLLITTYPMAEQRGLKPYEFPK